MKCKVLRLIHVLNCIFVLDMIRIYDAFLFHENYTLNIAHGDIVLDGIIDLSDLKAESKKLICASKLTNQIIIRKFNQTTSDLVLKNSTCYTTDQRNEYCPEDLTEVQSNNKKIRLCLKISEDPHQFEEQHCYGADTLAYENFLTKAETNYLTKFLKTINISTFWMPVKRVEGVKFNPFAVRLPGKNWGQLLLDSAFPTKDSLSNMHCMSASIMDDFTLQYEIVHCTLFLHSVCVFKKHFVPLSGCPQGFGAMSYKPDRCFGIDWKADMFPIDLRTVYLSEYFEKRQMFQLILKSINTNPNLYFSVGTIYNNSKKFAIEMDLKENFKIVSLPLQNFALSSELLTNRKNVILTLKTNLENDELILTVYNRNYIWRLGERDRDNFGIKCFTNAGYEKWENVRISMIWENELQTKTLFHLKVSHNSPGQYWCEAHTIFDFSFVETPKVVAAIHPKVYVFAVVINIPCDSKGCSDIQKEMKHYNKKTKIILDSHKSFLNRSKEYEEFKIMRVRIMNILSIDQNYTSARSLCHVILRPSPSKISSSAYTRIENVYNMENRDEIIEQIKLYNTLKTLLLQINKGLDVYVRSTEFCFPESFKMLNGESNRWLLGKLGQRTTSQKFCLQQTQLLPVICKCGGDFINGAQWEDCEETRTTCSTLKKPITEKLYNIMLSQDSTSPGKAAKDIKHIKAILENKSNSLIPADLYYIAKVVERSVQTTLDFTTKISLSSFFPAPKNNELEAVEDLLNICNHLLEMNDDIIRPSAILNTTNILLASFEVLIDKVVEPTASILIDTVDYQDIGVLVKITSNLIIFVIKPYVANVTGVAFFSSTQYKKEFAEAGKLRGAFQTEYYRFIMANETIDDLLFEEDIEMATYIPETLWNRLDEISYISNKTNRPLNQSSVVIKIYSNDRLFQEYKNYSDKSVSGKIVSVSIPDHDTELPEFLPLILKIKHNISNTSTTGCSYWNYNRWVHDGMTFLGRSNDNLVLCGCSHLTPFAYLIGGGYKQSIESRAVPIAKVHSAALDIITILGCSFSLFGVFCIFITAITFQTWRQKATSKVLLQFSAAIALQMVLICFVNTESYSTHLITNKMYATCIIIGASLHYTVLVQFCWMVIIAYLQFKRYVKIFGNMRPKRFFIKSFLLGWGTPLIPVIAVVLCDRNSYIPSQNVTIKAICYPTGYSLYFGVVFPIVAVILINFSIFLTVVYSILAGPKCTLRHSERRLVVAQIRLFILLFFLLGFTWLFGILSTMNSELIFPYLFCLTATLQGFVLFIYFIVLDPITRRLWSFYIKTRFGYKENYEKTRMKETQQSFDD